MTKEHPVTFPSFRARCFLPQPAEHPSPDSWNRKGLSSLQSNAIQLPVCACRSRPALFALLDKTNPQLYRTARLFSFRSARRELGTPSRPRLRCLIGYRIAITQDERKKSARSAHGPSRSITSQGESGFAALAPAFAFCLLRCRPPNRDSYPLTTPATFPNDERRGTPKQRAARGREAVRWLSAPGVGQHFTR